jgi:hypothetical protein
MAALGRNSQDSKENLGGRFFDQTQGLDRRTCNKYECSHCRGQGASSLEFAAYVLKDINGLVDLCVDRTHDAVIICYSYQQDKVAKFLDALFALVRMVTAGDVDTWDASGVAILFCNNLDSCPKHVLGDLVKSSRLEWIERLWAELSAFLVPQFPTCFKALLSSINEGDLFKSTLDLCTSIDSKVCKVAEFIPTLLLPLSSSPKTFEVVKAEPCCALLVWFALHV